MSALAMLAGLCSPIGASARLARPMSSNSRKRATLVARVRDPRQEQTTSCPWASATAAQSETPAELAEMVLSHMDLAEELDLVGLHFANGYENEIYPIPQLCIPALTLQDGPNGIAYGATKVTQLPAAIGIAASFDTDLAFAYGAVEGAEARAKGIDVIQGPDLNLARVPIAGRVFEGYGEDPYLSAKLGVADIEGIQSEGVMASAKHFSAYNQETDRRNLDQIVSARALEELYFAPFRAAVEQGHVASVMCAYGEINGVNTCEDPLLYRALDAWGFTGFVRSDLESTTNPVTAFRNGLDAVKPAVPTTLRAAVLNGALPRSVLDEAVKKTLTEMFAFGLIEHPSTGALDDDATSPAHIAFARRAAEESMVLLKDTGGVLPLSRKELSSLAVIGPDATQAALTAGNGSAHVIAPFVSSPLVALRNRAGPSAQITYADGNAENVPLPLIASKDLVSESLQSGISIAKSALKVIPAPERVGLSTLIEVVRPRASGLYSISVGDRSATWVFIDNHLVLSSPGPHGPLAWTIAHNFVAGEDYTFDAVYDPRGGLVPSLGWRDDSPAIAQAVSVARAARAAIVFAPDASGESSDRPSLALPGDENALISAVAAVNRRTVVVLNTGGAVLMPWLSKVAAVLEAWYPGEEDGAATVAVLDGAVDPSGHLPVTFPASLAETPGANASSYPGIDGRVLYNEGLDIGYRYDEAHGLRPLFPFGFGLSYTSFSFTGLNVVPAKYGYSVSATVENTGSREGTEVVQVYLAFPASAGEPPRQLKGFGDVTLDAGKSSAVTLSLPESAFRCYLDGHWTTISGAYTLYVGDSSVDLPLSMSLSAPAHPSPIPKAKKSGITAGAP
jgi:beta-glucosidase